MGQCAVQLHEGGAGDEEQRTLFHGIQQLNIALVMTDFEGNVQHANRAAAELTGYPDLSGKHIAILMPRNIAVNHAGYMRRYLSTRVGHIIGGPGREVNMIRRDKTSVSVILTVTVTDAGFVAALLDNRDAVELEKSKAHIASALRSIKKQTRFIQYLSHEIRVPLNALSLCVALVSDEAAFVKRVTGQVDKQVTAEYRRHCSDMRVCCDQITRLLNDVLDMDRMRTGIYQYDYGPVDVHQLVKQAESVSYLSVPPQPPKTSLTTFVAPQLQNFRLWIDSSRMLQVLTNFITTSLVQAGPSGSVVTTVTCKLIDDQDRDDVREAVGAPSSALATDVVFQVWNSGDAPSQKILDAVFRPFAVFDEQGTTSYADNGSEPFSAPALLNSAEHDAREAIQQQDGRRRNVHASLGMSIARMIVEQGHFGSVHYRSDQTGVVYEARIPSFLVKGSKIMASRARGVMRSNKKDDGDQNKGSSLQYAAAHVEEANTDTSTTSTQETTSRVDVLYVEDDLLNKRVIKQILKNEGLSTHVCSGGRQALEWLRDGNRPFVVLMDRSMAETDGETTTTIITAEFPGIPVIGLTGDAQSGHIEFMHRAGAVDVLLKPVRQQNLIDMIKNTASSSELRLQSTSAPSKEPSADAQEAP